MIHRWMEQWFDTVMFYMLMVGMLLFFLCYWQSEFQIRYAETVMLDFLTEVSVRGKITTESTEALINNLEKINRDYLVTVEGTKYVREPVFAQIPKDYLSAYFAERNCENKDAFQEYRLQILQEDATELKLQWETNASVLAAEHTGYLPLPKEEVVWKAEAVRPIQEVYENEQLITLCIITSSTGNFYVEAESVLAKQSGVVYLNLQSEGENYQIPVEVICYPRTVKCNYGHTVVNTEPVLREYQQTGGVNCPYCRELPVRLMAGSPVIYKKAGYKLTAEDVELEVEYMDGHTAFITPDSPDWQDSYDENFCGIQAVEVRYRGIAGVFTVISENMKCEICERNCNERCYTDYIRFPYCLNCLENRKVFTGEVYEAEQQISQEEIFNILEQKKDVCFSAGDFVSLKLINQGKVISLLQQKVRRDGEEK